MVRLALVTSVTCTPPRGPPVRFHSTQVSACRRARRRVSAAARTPSTFSRIHCSFAAGEVGGRRQSGLAPDDVAAAVAVQRRRDPVGAGVLPDDRVVVGPAGVAVPDQRRLALVGDAERGEVVGAAAWSCSAPTSAPTGCAPRSPPGCARPSRPAAGSARARAGDGPPRRPGDRRSCSGCWWCPGRSTATKSANGRIAPDGALRSAAIVHDGLHGQRVETRHRHRPTCRVAARTRPGWTACWRPTAPSTSTATTSTTSIKRGVIGALDWTGTRVRRTRPQFAHIVLRRGRRRGRSEDPRTGRRPRRAVAQVLEQHPTADGHRHRHQPRLGGRRWPPATSATTRARPCATMDATAIDAADGSFDLAVFALSFHHLPPGAGRAGLRRRHPGRRPSSLIIDLPRPPSPLHLLRAGDRWLPLAPVVPFVHDGLISSLRCYSPSALRALGAHADPAIEVELRSGFNTPQSWWQVHCLTFVASHRVGSGSRFVRAAPLDELHRPRGRRGQADQLQPRASPGVPAQGPAVPRRLRNDARPVQFRVRPAADRHGDRVQPGRRRLPARDDQPGCAGLDRRSGVPNRIGRLQHRIQCSAAPAAGPLRSGAGGRGARQPQRRRDQGQPERRAHRDGRHPAHADARTPGRQTG